MRSTSKRFITFIRQAVALLPAVALGFSPHPAAAQSEAVSVGPIQVLSDEPSYFDFGAGAFNIQGHRLSAPSALGQIELHYGRKLFFLGPAIGLLADTQGGVFGYGGIYSDLTYGQLVVTPLAGLGGYHRGGSIDLGGTFQFRLSLTVAYEFGDAARLGLRFAHISNAGIHNRNPGENEWLLTFAVPLQRNS
jgi:hypothetical protein